MMQDDLELAANRIGIAAVLRQNVALAGKGSVITTHTWEVYVEGSKKTLLCIAKTGEEAGEMISSLVQYYRETAIYSEKLEQWLGRVGLFHVREVLFQWEWRQQLLARLQSGMVQRCE